MLLFTPSSRSLMYIKHKKGPSKIISTGNRSSINLVISSKSISNLLDMILLSRTYTEKGLINFICSETQSLLCTRHFTNPQSYVMYWKQHDILLNIHIAGVVVVVCFHDLKFCLSSQVKAASCAGVVHATKYLSIKHLCCDLLTLL